jgi:glutamyl-tRNA reductase
MRCVYMDHTTEAVEVLGGLHHRLVREPPELHVRGLLLHTCHRVEWYSAAEGDLPISELESGKELIGEREVLGRLSKIASGAMSIIAGDSLVFRQVVEAGSRLERTAPERGLLQRAVRLAKEARRRFDLAPVVDYADVPRTLRFIDLRHGHPLATRLVVVGGGMLAQAIAAHSGPAYGDVVLVTRNTSRLRRTLALSCMGTEVGVTVVSIAAATAEALHGSFDIALATTSTNLAYLRNIETLAVHPNVGRALDYRATPLLPRSTPRHGHIRDEDIITRIIEANRPVEERAREAKAWIDSMAREVGRTP